MNYEDSGCSKASLLCAIVSIFIFPFIFSTIAVVLAIIGLSRNEYKQNNAIAGLVIGIISFLFSAYYYGLV